MITTSKAKRKIVQLATATSGHQNEMYPSLYALCDDGTVWIRNVGEWKTAEWSILPPIPQRSAP
jgi:hypothetical protein